MHSNFKTHRRTKATGLTQEKYRQSLLTSNDQKFLKQVRSSVEVSHNFLPGMAGSFKQSLAFPKPPSNIIERAPISSKNIGQSSSLLITINSLRSKISQAKSLLTTPTVPTVLSKENNILDQDFSFCAQEHTYFKKRENTSISTMNLESQKMLKTNTRTKQKIEWATGLKQYYIGHIARGVMGINDRAYDHLYQTHHFLSSGTIILPTNCETLTQLCHACDKSKKVLVIDLDQTLVHYHTIQNNLGQIEVEIEQGQKGYVAIRPYALSFLKKMSKHFEIIVFTASQQSYADVVLDELDPQGLIKHRLYRDHCLKLDSNLYTKDLRVINRDLSQVVFVDNSAISFLCQPENGIPILPFFGGEDRQLLELQRYLMQAATESDVRRLNRQVFKLQQYSQFHDVQSLLEELYENRQDYY